MIELFLAATISMREAPNFPEIDQLGIGPGAVSCKQYLEETESRDQREYWVVGFWSGANAAFGLRVGDRTPGEMIGEEVEKTCRDHPDWSLAPAVQSAYLRMARRGE